MEDSDMKHDVYVLAIDHRWQLEEMCADANADRDRIAPLKSLLARAFERVGETQDHLGILVDDQYGRELGLRLSGRGFWLGHAIDLPKSRPVQFQPGGEVEDQLRSWPADHVAKLMVYAHPDDPAAIADLQWSQMVRYVAAARAADRVCLVEFQTPHGVASPPHYLPRMLTDSYARGIAPNWWKLPPIAEPQQWTDAAAVIAANDPSCEGMLVLGQTAEPSQLAEALGAAAEEPMVRGFAIGRAIFGPAARQWLRNEIDDDALVDLVADQFRATIAAWQGAR
jgi:5-dehydro-2-deoxygluconokinase